MVRIFGGPACEGQTNCYNNNNSKDYCYSARIRSTVLQGLPFGGVPTVLALDFMCFLVLLFVFSILRKLAWDYGRLALVTDADSVASALHSETPDRYERLTSVSSSVDFEQRDNGFCSWLTAIFRIKDEEIREKCGEDAVHYLSFQRHIIGLLVVVGVLSVGIVLPVNFSGDLLAVDYHSLEFNRCANWIVLVMSGAIGSWVKSVSEERGTEREKGKRDRGRRAGGHEERETRRKGDRQAKGNNLLWLHTSFAFLYLLLTVYSMRRHTSKMHYKEDDLVKRTLFINGISKYAEENQIKQHFEQAYENCVVLEARICYNVAKLMALNAERKKTERSKKFFTDLQSKEHMPTMINPKPCGHLCCCAIKGCEEFTVYVTYRNQLQHPLPYSKCRPDTSHCLIQEEAVSYYTKLEAKLKEEYRKEKEKVNTKPLGMAFVTFQNEAMTAIILKDFNACQCQGCMCYQEPRSSPFSESLHVYNWSVTYAPDPQNVRWEHLSLGGVSWWIRCLIINCILFLLLFFLTTPAIIISTMDKFNVTKPVEYLNFGAAYAWMMCVFTVVMTYSITCPIIVPFVDRYNMYYAYLPSKLDKKIHSGAVNQVVAAPILCLFWLFFSTVRTGFMTPTSMFTFVVLIITIVVCLSHVCFGHFKYLSAHNYKQQMYIAQVLQDPNCDETGGGSGEDDGQGSSQDEEMINGGNSLTEADFQSGEDSLIANEVRH
ncbi:CSC1-like protein 2 [Bagarius yarrelli]|uniref:CSC1-like protein 2 n=1 Tax=Bagarius yarrelli TaxID=175774 RepID=A0A556VA01_BAGYA|nr:CSC1-like protein 2 [Bagarius yarrelli]